MVEDGRITIGATLTEAGEPVFAPLTGRGQWVFGLAGGGPVALAGTWVSASTWAGAVTLSGGPIALAGNWVSASIWSGAVGGQIVLVATSASASAWNAAAANNPALVANSPSVSAWNAALAAIYSAAWSSRSQWTVVLVPPPAPYQGPLSRAGGRGYVWYDPLVPANQYMSIDRGDPGVPAGYVLSGGTDGAIDQDVQFFKPGQASGGYPRYPADTGNSMAEDQRLLNGTIS